MLWYVMIQETRIARFIRRIAPFVALILLVCAVTMLPGTRTSAQEPGTPSVPTPTPTPTSAPAPADSFFDPQQLSYAPDFYESAIQQFLVDYPGPLKGLNLWVGNRQQSFAEVLVCETSLYSINPKILLALLEQQSGMLTTTEPTTEQMARAMGFEHDSGLRAQLHQAAIEIRFAIRDYAVRGGENLPDLVFFDGTQQATPEGISLSRYALSRVLAKTTTPENLPAKLNAFLRTYTNLFDDPRHPPKGWPSPAAPFLWWPTDRPARITSFFDHNTPFLQTNGSTMSYWGLEDAALSYDGHTGWDYALRPPDPVLAAADGTVVFAGNSDDGCNSPSRSVIIDHGNGYRTLYWHLDSFGVETGQTVTRGTQIGVAGETGCAIGPHLHFQVQYLGRDIDPYGWCATTPDPWAASPAGQQSRWLWANMPNPCGPPPQATLW